MNNRWNWLIPKEPFTTGFYSSPHLEHDFMQQIHLIKFKEQNYIINARTVKTIKYES